MSDSANIGLIRRWMDEVWNQQREPTVHELLRADAVGHLEGLTTHTVDEFMAARAILLEAFPDFRLHVEDVIAQGSNVAVRWTAAGTHRGALLDVPATGMAVTCRGATWFVVEDGRIVEGWDCWNQGRLLADLRVAASTRSQGSA